MSGGAVSTYGRSFPPGRNGLTRIGSSPPGKIHSPTWTCQESKQLQPIRSPGSIEVPDLDECVDVLVTEVPDVDEPPDSVWSGAANLAPFDRVHAVSPPWRGARLGIVVAHGDVDAVVVYRPQLGIRAEVHEGAADRMRLVHRGNRPAAVVVVVRLVDVQLARNGRHDRHSDKPGASATIGTCRKSVPNRRRS